MRCVLDLVHDVRIIILRCRVSQTLSYRETKERTYVEDQVRAEGLAQVVILRRCNGDDLVAAEMRNLESIHADRR